MPFDGPDGEDPVSYFNSFVHGLKHPSEKKLISAGERILEKIKLRTSEGESYTGEPFHVYNARYARRKGSEEVNLRSNFGEEHMMDALTVRVQLEPPTIEIGVFDNSREALLAEIHNQGSGITVRQGRGARFGPFGSFNSRRMIKSPGKEGEIRWLAKKHGAPIYRTNFPKDKSWGHIYREEQNQMRENLHPVVSPTRTRKSRQMTYAEHQQKFIDAFRNGGQAGVEEFNIKNFPLTGFGGTPSEVGSEFRIDRYPPLNVQPFKSVGRTGKTSGRVYSTPGHSGFRKDPFVKPSSGARIPARPFLGVPQSDLEWQAEQLAKHLGEAPALSQHPYSDLDWEI